MAQISEKREDPATLDVELAHLIVLSRQKMDDASRAALLADLGRRFNKLGRFADGRAALEQSNALAPGRPDTQRSLGLAMFGEGRWTEGLALYDSVRWKLDRFEKYRRDFPQPTWQGEDIAGKRLLLWAEQGIGDQVMEARVLGPLVATGADITVECDPRLGPLIERTWPEVKCVRQTVTLPKALVDGAFDYQGSLFSAWRWADLAKPQPGYLTPNGTLRDAFRRTWAAQGWGLNVGISWRSKAETTGGLRSIPTDLLRPLVSRKDMTFHSLQYDADPEECAALSRSLGSAIYSDRDGDPLKDMDRQAAQIAALDLVISIDNASVHSAGAVGTECWAMLPVGSDWRWGSGGDAPDRTILYDSLRLFRNAQINHWSGTVWDVIQALDLWVSERH